MDLENLALLMQQVVKFDALPTGGLNAADRSNARQALGEEIERRALALVAEVRRARGYHEFDSEDARALVHDDRPEPEPVVEPAPVLDGPFNGGKVRDCMLKYKSGFIIPELAADLDAAAAEVKRFVLIWAKAGQVEPTGFKVGRHVQYRYVKPQAVVRERPRAAPPERTTPGTYNAAQADGEAVRRGALNRLGKSRSKPKVGHIARQRDRRYEQGRRNKK